MNITWSNEQLYLEILKIGIRINVLPIKWKVGASMFGESLSIMYLYSILEIQCLMHASTIGCYYGFLILYYDL